MSVKASSTSSDEQGVCMSVVLTIKDKVVEEFQARPILRLTGYHPDYSFIKVRHALHDKGIAEYVVGDLAREEDLAADSVTPSVRNETEFTLLSYLYNQATLDSSKSPVAVDRGSLTDPGLSSAGENRPKEGCTCPGYQNVEGARFEGYLLGRFWAPASIVRHLHIRERHAIATSDRGSVQAQQFARFTLSRPRKSSRERRDASLY